MDAPVDKITHRIHARIRHESTAKPLLWEDFPNRGWDMDPDFYFQLLLHSSSAETLLIIATINTVIAAVHPPAVQTGQEAAGVDVQIL